MTAHPAEPKTAGKGRGEMWALLRLGAPVFLTQLGVVVVSFADTMMVGAYSTEALASAAFVNNLFMVPMVLLIGFAAGITPLAGALYSRGDLRQAGRVLRLGLRVNVAVALTVALVMGALYFFLRRMGQPSELMPLIEPYYLIILVSLLPAPVFNACQQTCNGMTDTLLPMWVILGANLLNIAGNYLLIFGHLGCPELGLNGAGISTLASRAAAAAVILWYCRRGKRYRGIQEGFRSLAEKEPGENRELSRRIFRTSFPVMLQSGTEAMIWAFGAVVCGWYGKIQLAAYQVTNVMSQIGFMAYLSFGTAVSIRCANKMGTRDYGGILTTARAGLGFNLLLAVGASAIFYFFARPLLGMFTADEAVRSVAQGLILPLILYQLFDAAQVTLSNAVRGTSYVRPLLYVSVGTYGVLGVPLMLALRGWMSVGVYYSFVIMLVAAFVAYWWSFRRILRGLRAQGSEG